MRFNSYPQCVLRGGALRASPRSKRIPQSARGRYIYPSTRPMYFDIETVRSMVYLARGDPKQTLRETETTRCMRLELIFLALIYASPGPFWAVLKVIVAQKAPTSKANPENCARSNSWPSRGVSHSSHYMQVSLESRVITRITDNHSGRYKSYGERMYRGLWS